MTLEDRLEQLANRTPPGDPADVLADARSRNARRPRLLAAAAAVVAVLALGAVGLAVLTGDDDAATTIAGPDRASSVDGEWQLAATVHGGARHPARGDAAITIHGDTVAGTDGCGNDVQTRLDGDTVTDPGFHTVAGCIDDEANDEATFFWDVLEREPVHELRDGELWLVDDEGNGLVFSRVDRDREEPAGAEPRDDLSDADARDIVSDFLRLAEDPSADAVDRLPFAEQIQLGLGSELLQSRSRTQLADPAAWIIDEEVFRAYSGPFSALEVAAGARSTVVSVGEHPHCASPPMPPPDEVADVTRVSVQPDMDESESCLRWWTVDFYVNETGQIEAVTLDLWEP